jgi:hypothetical protein
MASATKGHDPDRFASTGKSMNDWMLLILTWGPPITMFVLLCLQIYAYRRTRHYSLVLLAAGSTAGILYIAFGKLLTAESLSPRAGSAIIHTAVAMYVIYMVIGLWGAAALFRSYIGLTAANKGKIDA